GQQPRSLVPHGRPVEIFLPLAELAASPVVGVGEEESADDVRIPHAEGGREVGSREWLADLRREPRPRAEVLLGGVDQRAVHVPDERRRGHGGIVAADGSGRSPGRLPAGARPGRRVPARRGSCRPRGRGRLSMPKRYEYVTVDVFTDQPFAGNPVAVVTD